MTDCSACRALDDAKHAQRITEAALAQSQSKLAMLRQQIVRLQQQSGIIQGLTVKEVCEYLQINSMTWYKWKTRYTDIPKSIPGSYPEMYERGAIDGFIQKHPRLGKR